jgi:cell division protein FtsL
MKSKEKKMEKMGLTSFKVIAAALVFGSAINLASCNSSAEKVDNAEEALLEAAQDLDDANAEYLEDVENFRIETRERIDANNQSIIEFNARIDSQKKEAREAYKQDIADLEAQNTDMQKRMDDYKADSQENWSQFKEEFSKDMNDLGTAFTNFFTNDK